jgi:hypothetical protein
MIVNPNSEEYKYLNTIKVNIPELRLHIIELMKDGFEEIPLGDLLYIIWSMRNQNELSMEHHTT